MADRTREFFEMLWGDEPLEGARIVRWCLPSSASTLHADAASAAADCAATNAAGSEVYTGVSAVRADLPAGRGSLDDVRLVAGLMIDLDVIGPGRRKPNLWQSVDECSGFLSTLPLGPTLVVHSGNGLQAWWLFREPAETRTVEDRSRLSGVSRGWADVVRAAAKERERSVDATWDLARVARVPGTHNRKYGEPREVLIIAREPLRRYAVDDFDMFAAPPQTVGTVNVVRVVLDADANPPIDKMDVLREVEKKFALSWDRRRTDLNDQSASGYDMSLASLAARANWTDQEIANLLIAHRRRHGSDLKLREGYYAGVISKARDGVVVSELEAEIASVGITPDDEGRAKVLTVFSNRTGARLARVVQYLPEGKDLSFHFEDGRTFPITLRSLVKYMDLWLALCAAGFAPNPDPPKLKDWLAIVNNLVAVADKVVIEGSGRIARVASLCLDLARYYNVLGGPDTPAEGRARAIMQNGAFMRGGLLWVRLKGITRLARDERDPITPAEARHALAQLRAECRNIVATASPAITGEPEPTQKGGSCYGLELDRLRAAADLLGLPEAPPAAAGARSGAERGAGRV